MLSAALLLVVSGPVLAQSVARDSLTLDVIESSPSVRSDSTIVEIPVPISLRAPQDGAVGFRLRLSVLFAWNDIRFVDLGGADIEASLRTLTVIPGLELMIRVDDRWLVRPYLQLGGLGSLDVSGHRWLVSAGVRSGVRRELDRWILTAGGRVDFTAVFDDGWGQTDNVAFVDVGADFSFPLWFDLDGERPSAGVFIMARGYVEPAELVGNDTLDLGVDSHVEIGFSFQLGERPKLAFVSLPSWYGVGGRFAEGHRSFRIYLGFPF